MMKIDLIRFLDSYRIENSAESSHATAGWIQVHCPFCGDNNFHGGFNLSEVYYNCWKCGYHSLYEALSSLISCSIDDLKDIIKEFKNPLNSVIIKERQQFNNQTIELPRNTELQNRHKKYLKSRGFNPDEVALKYDLRGTDHIGQYKFRIIAPIYEDYRLVTFTSRSTSNKASKRYSTCPKEKEIIPIKQVLYGLDNVRGDSVIVAEGITDVWKLGDCSVATFGIQFSNEQVSKLVNRFTSIFILYDGETQAQEQAEKLANKLSIFNKSVEILTLENGDPADLDFNQVKRLKRQLNLN